MALSDYEFVPLTEETEIKPFDCGDNDLNAFLLDDAKKYLRDLLAVTYLIEDSRNGKTVAYFSLLNDKISLVPEEQKRWNRLNRKISNAKRRRNYPAVKVGRLAVSKDYCGQGIGAGIINFIKHAFTHGNRTGCRFLTVDAYDSAIGFYSSDHCRFEFFTEKDAGEETRLMIFDLKPFKDAAVSNEKTI